MVLTAQMFELPFAPLCACVRAWGYCVFTSVLSLAFFSVWHTAELDSLQDSTGQWLLPSLINHSFEPNLSWNIVGSNYVIRFEYS